MHYALSTLTDLLATELYHYVGWQKSAEWQLANMLVCVNRLIEKATEVNASLSANDTNFCHTDMSVNFSSSSVPNNSAKVNSAISAIFKQKVAVFFW